MASFVTVAVGTYDGDRSVTFGPSGSDGLVLESTYLWGMLRSRAEEPDIWTSLRRLSAGVTWPAGLLVQTNAGASGLRKHRAGRHGARSADATEHGSPTAPAWQAPGGDRSEPFGFAISATGVSWTEGELLDLAGAEVTPGLQWQLPAGDDRGDRDSDGMWYRSRIFRVTGTIDGVDVDGFVGCDEVHLSAGRQNYIDDPLTATHLSDAWCTWGTAYDDGSVEAGHVAYGRDGFGFGLRATDGVGSATTAVSGVVTSDDRGCPAHIAFNVDGEAWEFSADTRGVPEQVLPGPVRQAEGWFRRVGETRRPVAWFATPEIPAVRA